MLSADSFYSGARSGVELITEFNDAIRIFHTERLTPNGCGNKNFKLSENLLRLRSAGARSVLTFGGVWSNHVHAFALACARHQLEAVAVLRGEEGVSNELLQHAVSYGLRVHYVSRADYRLRHEQSFAKSLCEKLGCDDWLPEGGSNLTAVNSCRHIAELINSYSTVEPTHIVLAVGTGATFAGVVRGASDKQTVLGVPVVQDAGIPKRVTGWLDDIPSSARVHWRLLDTAMPARYGKADHALLQLVIDVHRNTGVVLDPVYNGKAFRSLLASGLDGGYDSKGVRNRIVFVHTGGLGGCLGWVDKLHQCCDHAHVERYIADARAILGLPG